VRLRSSIVTGALCLAASDACGAPIATVVDGPGKLQGVLLCQFEDDSKTLVVNDAGREVARLDFCSSYGHASADVVTDARGRSFVLLRYGEGRGTNAVQEYLAVFGLAKDLVEYARTPISAGAGPVSRWHYKYQVTKPPQGGIRLTLTLHVEGNDSAMWVPREKTRIVTVGQ
jgi:hypothetical protein